jgi:hypothetical protein
MLSLAIASRLPVMLAEAKMPLRHDFPPVRIRV